MNYFTIRPLVAALLVLTPPQAPHQNLSAHAKAGCVSGPEASVSYPGKKSQFCLGELLLSEMKVQYPNAEGLGLASRVREDSVAFYLSFGLLDDSDARLSSVHILVELGTSDGSAQLGVAKAFYASGSPEVWVDCSGERVDGSLLKNCGAIVVRGKSNASYRTIVGLSDVPASREMPARRMLSVQREIMNE